MSNKKINILIINGIRDDGSVDHIRADSLGRISFSSAGSCHVATYLSRNVFNVDHFILDHNEKQQANARFLMDHDIVFCEIADPDSHSCALRKARDLHDLLQGKIPWINNPHRVLNTRRDRIPELLAGIDRVKVPQTLRIKPDSIAAIETAVADSALEYPVLIRPSGSHGGANLELIANPYDLHKLNLASYPEALLTQFVDFGNEGVYTKYRFAVVDGEPFLRHVLYHDHWMIHSRARHYMSSRPELKKTEADSLSNFETDLKSIVQEPVREIQHRIGLDYFGIDCTISDEQLLLFEVNANMNILHNNQPLPNIWEAAIERIHAEITNKLILNRAGKQALASA